jgi:hypothetical protein
VIATRLEDWSLEAIKVMADSGANENDIYDFKADLQPADHQRKSVAAFANTRGGFLIYGVTDDRRVEGVANAELPRDFGGKLKAQIEPSVEYRFLAPIEVSSGRNIFVVEIPRSLHVPHAVSVNGTWTFFKRTAAGNNDPMTYEEIRAAFQNSEQQYAHLLLFKNEIERLSQFAERQATATGPLDSILAIRYNTGRLEGTLPLIFLRLAGDPILISKLNELRDAAAEADSHLASVSAYAELSLYQKQAIRDKAGRDAQRVTISSRRVLERLQEITP